MIKQTHRSYSSIIAFVFELRWLIGLFLFPLLLACTNPLGGKSNIQSGFLAGLIPSLVPTITVAHSNLTSLNTTAYTVSGGKAPYTVTVDQGTISNPTGSGTYTPAGTNGSATIHVMDSAGATGQAVINTVSSITFGIGGPLPSNLSRYIQSTVAISGKMYVFGGVNGSSENDTWVFDPSTSTSGAWSQLTPSGTLPPPRYYQTAAAVSGKMYMFGGCGNVGCPSSDLWVFDSAAGANGSWTQLTPSGPTPSARYGSSFTTIAGKIYLFSGSNGVNDTWVFDPSAGANGSWTQLSPSGSIPSTRLGATPVNISGKMYLFGGYNGSFKNDTWVFDPSAGSNGSWTQLSPSGSIPPGRYGNAAVNISGKMYIFAGYGGGYTNDTWVYDPSNGANGSWSQLTPSGSTPAIRFYLSSASIANKMYIFGGCGGAGCPSQDSWVLDPNSGASGAWTQETPVYLQSSVTLAVNDIDIYQVSGGVPPYSITTNTGAVSNSAGSGNYTASSTSGSDVLTVTDSLGNVATVNINVNPALNIITGLASITTGSTVSYTVSGGLPPYSVIVDNGSVDTANGSGIYSTNGSPSIATITVTDVLGNSANAVINVVSSDLGISVSPQWVDLNSSVSYSVYGGDGNYSVTVDNGSVDTPNGSGNYYPTGSTGAANITVTDNGVSANAALIVYAPLSITIGNQFPYAGDSTPYTVSGGSGNYSVGTSNGSSIDNGSGSGTFTANGYTTWDQINVYDNVTGESTNVDVFFSYYPLTITVDNSNLNYNDTTNYYISGGSGNYNVYTSTGGGYTNSNGSGTYYADPCCGYTYDDISVYDNNTGQYADVYININIPPLSITVDNSNLNYNDTTNYYVSGGSGYYNVSTSTGGGYSNSYGSGTYYATPCCNYSYDDIYVYDNYTGQYADVYITINYPPLSIVVNNTTMNVGDTTTYTVSGGSGNFSISADYGNIDGGSPSGNYTATGGGYANITVYDNNIGNSVSQQIVIYGNLQINVSPSAVTPLGTATYSAVNQNCLSYNWSIDNGSIDTPSGASGTFTAPNSILTANLSLTDDLGNTGTYQINVAAGGTWTAVYGFEPRYGQVTATILSKMYLFGGQVNGGPTSATWVFDPSSGASGSWTLLYPTGATPPGKFLASAVVISNKMYVFGGYANSGVSNDLWVFDPSAGANGSWTQLSPSGTAPSTRYSATAVSISNKMYLFGGYSGGLKNDTWVFDPSSGANGSWSQLSPSGTPPTARNSVASAVVSSKMYIFGGNTSGGDVNDLWSFDPSNGANGAWTQLSPSGTTPGARAFATASVISSELYLFAGLNLNGSYASDTWALNTTSNSWTQLTPTGEGPAQRYLTSTAVISNKMYMFGGYGYTGLIGDLWSYDPSVKLWTQLSPSGTAPPAMYAHGALVISSKMYIIEGWSNSGYNNYVWVYDPSAGASGSWTQLSPSNPPPGRYYTDAVVISNKIYLFGGCGNAGCPTNDTWVYDPSAGANGTWTQLSPSGSISNRYLSASVAISNKMYLFGGAGNGGYLNDTWVFDPSVGANGSWTQLNATRSPTARYGHTAVVMNGKMCVFAGNANPTPDALVTCYDTTTNSWLAEPSSGSIPPVQYLHKASQISNTMIIFGGENPLTNDVYQYQPAP